MGPYELVIPSGHALGLRILSFYICYLMRAIKSHYSVHLIKGGAGGGAKGLSWQLDGLLSMGLPCLRCFKYSGQQFIYTEILCCLLTILLR